jgi:WD40 repeat protein
MRLGTARLRDENDIPFLKFAGDGKTFVTLSRSRILRWDAATGRRLQALPAPARVELIAPSPDGCRLAFTQGNGSIGLLNLSTGTTLWQLEDRGRTHTLCFSPDGTLLIGMEEDGAIRFRDGETGRSLHRLEDSKGKSRNMALSPDGTLLTVWGNSPSVRVLELSLKGEPSTWTARERCALSGSFHSAARAAIAPDGRTIAVKDEHGFIHVMSLPDGKKLARLAGTRHGRGALQFLSAPGLLASFGGSTHRRGFAHCVWSLSDFRERLSIEGLDCDGELSPDGMTLALVHDHSVALWDVATGTERRLAPGHTSAIRDVAISPDGKHSASLSTNGEVRIWDAAGRPCANFEAESADGLAFSPDSSILAVQESDDVILLWSLDPARPNARMRAGGDQVTRLAFTPDGRRLAVATMEDPRRHLNGAHSITLCDLATGLEIKRFPADTRVLSMALSADGRCLAAGQIGGTIDLWDIESGERLRTTDAEGAPVTSLAFSPDGATLAYGLEVGRIQSREGIENMPVVLWDTRRHRERLRLYGHLGRTLRVAFSPDGKVLATRGDALSTIALWDADTGRQMSELLVSPEECPPSLAFSPDGTRLAAGMPDTTVLLFDLPAVLRAADAARHAGPPDFESLWAKLSSRHALQAVRELADAGDEAVGFLKSRLEAVSVNPCRADAIRNLVRDLNDSDIAIREAAQRDLVLAGWDALVTIRRLDEDRLSAEARVRLEDVLSHLDVLGSPGDEESAVAARRFFAIPALESIGTPAAEEALRRLSDTSPSMRERRASFAAAERLKRRSAPPSPAPVLNVDGRKF